MVGVTDSWDSGPGGYLVPLPERLLKATRFLFSTQARTPNTA